MTIGIDVRLWSQTGIGRYIRNLVLNLLEIDKKNSYVLFALSEDIDEIKNYKFKSEKYKIVTANVKWHTFSEQTKFFAIIHKQKLDLVHFPYQTLPVFYGKPYIITIHDLIPFHFATGKASTLSLPAYLVKYNFYKFVITKAAQGAKSILVPSIATKTDVCKSLRVNENKIIVTEEGVDEKLVSKVTKDKNLNFGKYFLYIGNAYPHKNLDKLIEAFNKLIIGNIKLKDYKLILIGKKDYFYKELEEKTISKNIVFYGQATDSEINSLLKNALALVQPSLMEGFGLPVLEAMTNRCLVIASDIPSIREIAKQNILYFVPQNEESIREKLEEVIGAKKSYKSIIDNAFIRSKDFSWEKMARQTLQVYESSI